MNVNSTRPPSIMKKEEGGGSEKRARFETSPTSHPYKSTTCPVHTLFAAAAVALLLFAAAHPTAYCLPMLRADRACWTENMVSFSQTPYYLFFHAYCTPLSLKRELDENALAIVSSWDRVIKRPNQLANPHPEQ